MVDSAPLRVQRSKTKTVLMITGIAVPVGISAAVIVAFGIAVLSFSNHPRPSPVVSISGSVTTKGPDSHPTGVMLVDQSSHAHVTGSVSGTHYQVFAPNGSHTWRVILSWQGLGGSRGTCGGGFVQYDNVISGFMSQDISC